MGIIDSSWKLSYDDIISWNSLPKEKLQEMDLRMAIYAAMVDRMDQKYWEISKVFKKKKNYMIIV